MSKNCIDAIASAEVMHYDRTPAEKFREHFSRRLIRTSQLMSVVLEVEGGPWAQADPFHSHPHEQISYVAEGEVLFLCEGIEPQRLKSGDLFAVPSGKGHTIQLLSTRARLVDTFHPVREDFLAG
jgi:quercetin dioxygenase-like cupin family protein